MNKLTQERLRLLTKQLNTEIELISNISCKGSWNVPDVYQHIDDEVNFRLYGIAKEEANLLYNDLCDIRNAASRLLCEQLGLV